MDVATAIQLDLAASTATTLAGADGSLWKNVAVTLGYADIRTPMIYKQRLYNADLLLLKMSIQQLTRYNRRQEKALLAKAAYLKPNEYGVKLDANGSAIIGWTSDNLAVGGVGDVLDYGAYALLWFLPNYNTGALPVSCTTSPAGAVRLGTLTRSAAATEKSGTLAVTVPGSTLSGNGFYRWHPLNDDGSYVDLATVPSESYPMLPLTIDLDGTAKDFPWYCTALSDWEWHDDGAFAMHAFSVKSVEFDTLQARPRALDTRPWPSFTQLDWPKLYTTELVAPLGQMLAYRPARDRSGRVFTCGVQPYFTYDFFDVVPRTGVRGGEFGVAYLSHVIGIDVGRNNKEYVFTPDTWTAVQTTGRVRVMLGFEYSEDVVANDTELLNSIPVLQGGPRPHEKMIIRGQWPSGFPWWACRPKLCWNGFFWEATTQQGTGAPVQDSTMYAPEAPHDAEVESRFTNGYGDRVMRGRHPASNHNTTVIAELAAQMPGTTYNPLAGKTDQLGTVNLHDGTYIAIWREAHKLLRFKMNKHPMMDEFIEQINPPVPSTVFGKVVDHQWVCTSHTVAGLRALEMPVAPETGDSMPDWDWVCFGCSGQGWTWEWNRVTKEWRVAYPERDGTQSQTLLYAVKYSDGTCMPKGAILHCDFDNQTSGLRVHLPIAGVGSDGHAYSHCSVVAGKDVAYVGAFESVSFVGQAFGVGPQQNSVYPLVANAKQGRITVGGTEGMLRQWRMPMPGDDPMPDQNRLKLGFQEFTAAGYVTEYGQGGWGASAKALPTSGNIPYYLRYGQGHFELGPVA